VNQGKNAKDREIRMERPILLVDADKAECKKLSTSLESKNYRIVASHSLSNLERNVEEGAVQVVILDLDNLPVDNRFITHLRRENPGVRIMGLSNRPFHPELKEAISKHFYACLYRPVDMEELFYWLRSIDDNEVGSENSAG
jgi:DNA-binding NtrC family response regulator